MNKSISSKINIYSSELKAYNEIHNIYSKLAYKHLDFHITNSIHMSEIIGQKCKCIVDWGSGSGLPSVPLAICLPDTDVYAIESKSRKSRFLEKCRDDIDLPNYHPITAAVQDWALDPKPQRLDQIDYITAKAFKPLPKLIQLAKSLPLAKKTRLLVPISQKQADEFNTEYGKHIRSYTSGTETFIYFESKLSML